MGTLTAAHRGLRVASILHPAPQPEAPEQTCTTHPPGSCSGCSQLQNGIMSCLDSLIVF